LKFDRKRIFDMHILVTGGAGYIGSHTCLQLLQRGDTVTVFDNLANSSPVALDRVAALAGRPINFVKGDIRDDAALAALFEAHRFDAVVHFAGLKAVGESVAQPLRYYDNNVGGTLSLLHAMQVAGVKTLVFSSSATVYGDPQTLPITEDAPRSATNPYGQSKLMIEHILADLCTAEPPVGGWHGCATSTPWVPTPVARLAKTRVAFPIT
jgi:UDP-glucose 4-epimerase